MAGRRRTRDATPGPSQRSVRKDNRRAAMAARWALAATPSQRFVAASDYVRGALARRQPDPEWAGQLTDEHAHALVAFGDRILEAQGRERITKEVAAQ